MPVAGNEGPLMVIVDPDYRFASEYSTLQFRFNLFVSLTHGRVAFGLVRKSQRAK